MAAISLFWDTNMAAVTSCENTLFVLIINHEIKIHGNANLKDFGYIARKLDCRQSLFCSRIRGEERIQDIRSASRVRERRKTPLLAALPLARATPASNILRSRTKDRLLIVYEDACYVGYSQV